jgi:hypothetical protein
VLSPESIKKLSRLDSLIKSKQKDSEGFKKSNVDAIRHIPSELREKLKLTLVNKTNWPFDHKNHKLYISPKVKGLKTLQTGFQTYYKSIYRGEANFQNMFTNCEIQFKIKIKDTLETQNIKNKEKNQEKNENQILEEKPENEKRIIEEKEEVKEPQITSEKWTVEIKVDIECASLLLFLGSQKSRSFDFIAYQLQIKSDKLEEIMARINSFVDLLFLNEKREIKTRKMLKWSQLEEAKTRNNVIINPGQKLILISKLEQKNYKFHQEKNLESRISKLKEERISELNEKNKLEKK